MRSVPRLACATAFVFLVLGLVAAGPVSLQADPLSDAENGAIVTLPQDTNGCPFEPGGSYQYSCTGCTAVPMDAESCQLSCACEDASGASGLTSLNVGPDTCMSGINNCDGTLSCGSC